MSFYKYLITAIFFLIVSCSGESAEFFYKTGEDLWNEGKVERSLKNFLIVIEKYPDSGLYDDALLRLGELYYFNNSDFANAIKYFSQLLLTKNSPTKLKFQAQNYIAEIYENSLNNYDQAIIEYQRLINNFENRISPDFGQYKIATCYYKKGDYRQAIVEYEILSERFPASSLVEKSMYQMVASYFILGDCSEVVNKYNIFKDKFPESKFMTDIQFEIGSCYEEDGELIKSLDVFKELKGSYSNQELLEMKISSIEKRLSMRRR